MLKFYQWIKKEIINIIPAVIYFVIAFNLIHFTVGLSLCAGEPRDYTYWTVTLGALIVGKMLLIINSFPFVNLFPNKPLACNITWKFFLYGFFVFIFHTLEAIFHYSLKYKNIDQAYVLLKAELVSSLFWATQMWLLLLFFIFVVFSEFVRILGKNKVKEILFGK